MFEKYCGLRARPFTMHSGPYFLYWGRNLSLAYGTVEYSILNQVGFTAIIDEIGCGNTTLLSQLLHCFDDCGSMQQIMPIT